MRTYIIDNQRQFLGNLTVIFVENTVAIETQKSFNKRIQEEERFGGCQARGCQNLEWALESNEEMEQRLYAEYMKTPIFIEE